MASKKLPPKPKAKPTVKLPPPKPKSKPEIVQKVVFDKEKSKKITEKERILEVELLLQKEHEKNISESIAIGELGYISGAEVMEEIVNKGTEIMYERYLNAKLNYFAITDLFEHMNDIQFEHGESKKEMTLNWKSSDQPCAPPLDNWIRGAVKSTTANEIYESIRPVLCFESFMRAAETIGTRIKKSARTPKNVPRKTVFLRPMTASTRPETAESWGSVKGKKGLAVNTITSISKGGRGSNFTGFAQTARSQRVRDDQKLPEIRIDIDETPAARDILLNDLRGVVPKLTEKEREENKIFIAEIDFIDDNLKHLKQLELDQQLEEERLMKLNYKLMHDQGKKHYTLDYDTHPIFISKVDQRKLPKANFAKLKEGNETMPIEVDVRDTYKKCDWDQEAFETRTKTKPSRLKESEIIPSFNIEPMPSKALTLEYGVKLIENGEEYMGEKKNINILSPKEYKDKLEFQEEREAIAKDKELRTKALKEKRNAKIRGREAQLKNLINMKPGGAKQINTYKDDNLHISKSATHQSYGNALLPSKGKRKLPKIKNPHLVDKIYDYVKPSQEEIDVVPGSIVARFNNKLRLHKGGTMLKSKEDQAQTSRTPRVRKLDKRVFGKPADLGIIDEKDINKKGLIGTTMGTRSHKLLLQGRKTANEQRRLPPPPLGKTMGHGFIHIKRNLQALNLK